MKVFVLNMRGRPLMPCSPARARHLLKAGKAVVRRRTPFTIQLRIATGETKQSVTLGVDAGAKHVGLSAATEKERSLRPKSNFDRTSRGFWLLGSHCVVIDVIARRATVRRAF